MKARWQSVPLGSVCSLVNGRAFKPSDWVRQGVPIVRIQNLNDTAKPFNFYDKPVRDRFLVDTGDILLSWSGTPGTSFGCFIWQRGRAILNQHIFKVHVNDSLVDPEFFVHMVNSRLDEMISLAHGGVGLRHITKNKLESIEVSFPQIPEQRRIVSCIKILLDKAWEIATLRKECFKETCAVFPSLLANAFNELGATVPQRTIDEVTLETRYGTSHKCYSEQKGTPVFRIPNIYQGSVLTSNLKYCELPENELSLLALEPGDLLIVRTNGSEDLVGRCAVFDGKSSTYAYASYLIRVRVDKKVVNPHFLSFFLESTLGRDAIRERRRTSAGQFNINTENLRTISFPCPSPDIQMEMVERMRNQRELANAIRDEIAAQHTAAEPLEEAILRKAFAGEL